MHAREASSSDGDAAPSAGPGTAPGKNACVCFTAFSATAFPPGGMRGVREAGACRAGMFFKSVCDRRYASRTRRFPGRSRPRFQSGRYSGRAFSAVRPVRMPCRSLGCHPLARTGSAHFRAQGTELAPLFPEVEEESLTGFGGGDKFWCAACAAAPHPAHARHLHRVRQSPGLSLGSSARKGRGSFP